MQHDLPPSANDMHHSNDGAHHAISWLLSGLYAMVILDIGMVMKVSQFIAVDVSLILMIVYTYSENHFLKREFCKI